MPLPDERPRASVANLIGRFEQTQKRQSLTFTGGSAATRSSSVASHNTGDSAKEEVKERREWPPKPLENKSAPPSSWSRSASHISDTKPLLSDPEPDLPKPEKTSSTSPPVSSPSPERPPEIAASETRSTPSKPAASKASSAASKTPAKTPAKTPSKAAPSSASSRTPAKSGTVKPSVSTPSQPLRPQHTGPASTGASARKANLPRPASTTPSRPKTPSRTSVGASRPKTPSSIGRATPSSGIYSSTAATRARSSEPPAPTRRTTMSPEAADRLSKPTAASASKARNASDSPSKATVKSAAQKAREAAAASHAIKKGLNQIGPVKKPLPSTLKPKKPAASTAKKTAAASNEDIESSGPAEVSETSHTSQLSEEPAPSVQNGHGIGVKESSSAIEVPDLSQDMVAHEESHKEPSPPATPEQRYSPEGAAPAEEVHPPTDSAVTLADPSTTLDDSVKSTGDDIADMVSMLEGGKPLHGGGAVDEIKVPVDEEVQEIPDEDAL